MREREAKLIVDPGVELPAPERLLEGLGDFSVGEVDQQASYFDTPDLRLIRSGVSLRYRSDDGWTVKLPESRDAATFVRTEHDFSGDPGDPPRPAVELVRSWARSSPLVEVAQIHTHRRRVTVIDGAGRRLGEIDDDEVTASIAHQDQTQFHEIEIEMREDTDPRVTDVLVARLRRAGAGNGSAMPKVARALGERAREPPDVVAPKRLRRGSTVGELVQASITASVQRLLEQDPLIRVGEDPEAIHQARVATRRLRSDLRTFRPVVDRSWSEPLRDELKWLGEQLGRVRDADVLLDLLISKSAGLPASRREEAGVLIDRLREMRGRDRDELLDAMRSARYADLLERLVDATRAPRLRKGKKGKRAARVAGTLTRRPAKRLRRTVKRLPKHPPDTDLHEVRKRAKQARYALEAVTPIVGKEAKRSAKRLADLQDVLGEHQDAVVATAWLAAAANDSADTSTAFVAGEIAGAFAADRRRLRKQWPKTWKRAEPDLA